MKPHPSVLPLTIRVQSRLGSSVCKPPRACSIIEPWVPGVGIIGKLSRPSPKVDIHQPTHPYLGDRPCTRDGLFLCKINRIFYKTTSNFILLFYNVVIINNKNRAARKPTRYIYKNYSMIR